MKKIIITGGLGYIGSQITKKLIQKKYKVIILDNFLTNTSKKIEGAEIIKCDITSFENLSKIKIEEADAILHLAAQSSGPNSYNNPELDIKINVLGTVNLINFCKKTFSQVLFPNVLERKSEILNRILGLISSSLIVPWT